MNPATNRVVLAPLCLAMLFAGACHHGGSGTPSTPSPPLDPRIAGLAGTWVVETDNFVVLAGVEAPIGIDNAVVQAVVDGSRPEDQGTSFRIACANVQAPELGLAMNAIEIDDEIQLVFGGIFYLPQHDVTVTFGATEWPLGAAPIEMAAGADVYAGMRIVERQDPISQDSYWDIADDSELVGRMVFDLRLRR